MADLEQLLQSWGAWVDAGGRVAGYSATNPLHPNWTPPSTGPNWRMPVPRSDATPRRVHAAVAELPPKLRDALVVVYVLKLRPAERGQRVGCGDSAFGARVQRARAALGARLAEAAEVCG